MDTAIRDPQMPNSASRHRAQEWETHRRDFQRLYVMEGKPLEKVMEEMHRVHGFQAT